VTGPLRRMDDLADRSARWLLVSRARWISFAAVYAVLGMGVIYACAFVWTQLLAPGLGVRHTSTAAAFEDFVSALFAYYVLKFVVRVALALLKARRSR
jgi:hypothetical protein